VKRFASNWISLSFFLYVVYARAAASIFANVVLVAYDMVVVDADADVGSYVGVDF